LKRRNYILLFKYLILLTRQTTLSLPTGQAGGQTSKLNKMKTISNTYFIIILFLILYQQVLSQTFYYENYSPLMNGYSLQDDTLNVLQGKTDTILHVYLLKEVQKQFDIRRQQVKQALKSVENLKKRQQQLKTDYIKLLGEFPSKTPLNPLITGTIQCEDYIIERLVFESRPGLHVTANLYVPKNKKGPFPGVLVACGHSYEGKASPAYQSVCILLAKNDMVALIVDPICQGERFQFLNEDGKPASGGGTFSHTLLDIAANLVGTDVVFYEAWDNIRAIDYLISRSEVDPEKIGMTGNSGGGTQTTFLMALDDRIVAAAPACYPATKEIKFNTIGPQDGCQQLHNEGKLGIEETDFFTIRAPKPTRILAAEQDFFDFNGTQTLYREAKEIYTKLGYPDQIDLVSCKKEHGFTKPLREAAVFWMKKWLLKKNTPVVEPELKLQKEKDLLVTTTGQVGSFFKNEKTIIDLNRELATKLKDQREVFWKLNSKEVILTKVKELAGIEEYSIDPEVVRTGVIHREGYIVEKLILNNAEFPVPGLLFIPDNLNKSVPANLYVDGRGKATNAGPEGEIEKMVKNNTIVFAIDIRGFGETADNPEFNLYAGGWNNEYRNGMISLYLGKPLPGQRVFDLQLALKYLLTRKEVDQEKISITGIGRAVPAVLHAAAIESTFCKVFLCASLDSWMDVVLNPMNRNHLTNLVPDALKFYDLPDLVRSIHPREISIIDPVDASGKKKLGKY
jgi:cephalosporin-C deacetylase-like acetyl esterase